MSDVQKTKKNALNNPKIVLTAPCPVAPGKVSRLTWEIYQNNPRMVVRTNDPSLASKETSFGMIQAGMDALSFYAFLELLKEFALSEPEKKARIENAGYEGDHLSDIWVGKDKDGCVFISIIDRKNERPVIKFIFGTASVPGKPDDQYFHKYYHADGTQYTKAELSVLSAKAYYRILGEFMANILVQNYVEPPPYVPKGGNSYQKNNTYQRNQSSNDDLGGDLPF